VQSERVVRTEKASQPAQGTHQLLGTVQGIGQDSKRKLASKGALTNCRAQSKGLVGTVKESQPVRGTHQLSSAEQLKGLVMIAKESQPARGTYQLTSTM
jgi:hypothetical protein